MKIVTWNSLHNIADEIQENPVDGVDDFSDDDTEELENRLDIIRGDQPRHKKIVEDNSENTLVTLPLKVV